MESVSARRRNVGKMWGKTTLGCSGSFARRRASGTSLPAVKPGTLSVCYGEAAGGGAPDALSLMFIEAAGSSACMAEEARSTDKRADSYGSRWNAGSNGW